LPGSEKATLILAGGEIIELDSKSDTIQIGNKLITIKNSTVDYTTSSFETHQEQYNTLVVKRGETFSLLLKDGTRVYLNSESTLHYPVQFSNSERMVELTGEGYFEVAYDYKKPFKVIVDNETVEVLGTSFNVHAYPEEEVITTTLVDGEVRIYDYNHPEIENLLHPNQQALLNKKDGQIIIHEVNVDNYVSWKDGYFFFQNQRLEDMMITLSRWYDIEVVFKNENVKNMRFGGKLKKFDDLNKFLIMIEKAGDLKIETDQKTVKINN